MRGFVRAVLKSWKLLPVVVAVAALCAAVAYNHQRTTWSPVYQCEAIAVVWHGGLEGVGVKPNEAAQATAWNPSDYALLVQSDAVAAVTAEAYNRAYVPEPPLTAHAVTKRVKAVMRQEKDASGVTRYRPTIQLRATGSTAVEAYRLATIWADIAERWCRKLELSFRARVQESPLVLGEEAVNEANDATAAQEPEGSETGETALETRPHWPAPVQHFEVVANPVLPVETPPPSHIRVALLVFVCVFMGGWLFLLLGAGFHSVAVEVRRG